MATKSIDLVLSFIAEWEKGRGAMRQAMVDYLAPNGVWENVGLSRTCGPDAALALLDMFENQVGVVAIAVDMLAIAEDRGRVFTERNRPLACV